MCWLIDVIDGLTDKLTDRFCVNIGCPSVPWHDPSHPPWRRTSTTTVARNGYRFLYPSTPLTSLTRHRPSSVQVRRPRPRPPDDRQGLVAGGHRQPLHGGGAQRLPLPLPVRSRHRPVAVHARLPAQRPPAGQRQPSRRAAPPLSQLPLQRTPQVGDNDNNKKIESRSDRSKHFYKHFYIGCLKTQKQQQLHFVNKQKIKKLKIWKK